MAFEKDHASNKHLQGVERELICLIISFC